MAGGEGDDAHARGLDGAGAGRMRRRAIEGGACRIPVARRSASRRQLADVERFGHL